MKRQTHKRSKSLRLTPYNNFISKACIYIKTSYLANLLGVNVGYVCVMRNGSRSISQNLINKIKQLTGLSEADVVDGWLSKTPKAEEKLLFGLIGAVAEMGYVIKRPEL